MSKIKAFDTHIIMQAFIKEFYELIVYNQSLNQNQIKVKAIFPKTTKIQIISQKDC